MLQNLFNEQKINKRKENAFIFEDSNGFLFLFQPISSAGSTCRGPLEQDSEDYFAL